MDEFLSNLEARLGYFKTRVLRWYPPAPEEAIARAEMELRCNLSPQYKAFLRWHNGGYILEINLRGVQLLGIKRIPKRMDIVAQNLSNWSYEWWPRRWLELGTDGFGNYYIADLSRRDETGEYPILFVDHETLGGEVATRDFAPSYFQFLSQVVDEMIDLYDPYGKLKRKLKP